MTNVRSQPGATRILASQSLSLGSSAGASSTPFGSQTMLIRAISNQPATFIIGDGVSVSSTVIAITGAALPANLPEYFTVAAGQRLAATTSSTSAVLVISECG